MSDATGPGDGHTATPREAGDASAPGEQPEHAAAGPWGVFDALLVLLLTAVTTSVVIAAAALLSPAPGLPDALAPLLLPLPLLLLAGITLAWVHARYRAVRRLLGPARARARDWLIGIGWGVGGFLGVNIVLGLLLQALAALAGYELPQPQQEVRDAVADPGLAPWLILSAVVVAPVSEELFFRGMLQPALRRHMRAVWAIVLTAVAFAAAHILQELGGGAGPVAFVLILPLGLLLGWLFERRGTLATPIAVHAVFNLITVGLVLIPVA